jgi:UDPglucose 6-dehydrogenase
MEELWEHGARVQAYDPVAMDEARRTFGDRKDLTLVKNANAALVGADALAIVTEWQEFRSPDFDNIKSQLKSPVIFDGRNLYDPSYLARLGITYYGVGRGARLDLS